MPTPIPSYINADARVLVDLFSECSIGNVVSYDQMSDALGFPVKTRRYLIPGAIRTVNKETGSAFAVIVKVGYRRLSGDELPNIGHSARGRIRRTSRRAAAIMTRALQGQNDVNPDAERRIYAEVSVLGLVEYLAKDRTVKVLPPTMERPEPIAKVLKLMFDNLAGEANAAA